jgi:hypothetical protein
VDYGGYFERKCRLLRRLEHLELEGGKVRRFMSPYFDTRHFPDQLVD